MREVTEHISSLTWRGEIRSWCVGGKGATSIEWLAAPVVPGLFICSVVSARCAWLSEAGRSGDWGKELRRERDSRVASDLRAEVPLAGLSCPANAAGNNVTSVSLAVNPGPPQFVFIWIFVLEESSWDQREQVDCVDAKVARVSGPGD